MTILVTGATGTVGSQVTRHLAAAGADVRALTRSPQSAALPAGVTPVKGELGDPDALRAALAGVSGLFLLSPVVPDELTTTLIAIDLAHAAGVRDLVYLSVIHADAYPAPPHFVAKGAAERLIADLDMAATILRPGYYMQNDARLKDRLFGAGVYDPPVGNKSVLMVDTRDLAEVAARALLRRQGADRPQARQTLDVVSHEVLTGESIATIWSEVLGRPVAYGGDDLDAYERALRAMVPAWMACDMRLMMRSYQTRGMSANPDDDERLRDLLGRPLRTYRDFARETAQAWQA